MNSWSDDDGRNRLLIPGIAAVTILAVVAVVVLLVSRGGDSATLSVRSVPGDLTLTLDGREVAATGETTITPGEHTLLARRSGFGDETRKFAIGKDQTYTLTMYLYANSDEGRDWYGDHPDDEAEAEAEKGRKFHEDGERRTRNNPILSQLPFIGAGFRIDYGRSQKHPDDNQAVALYIKLRYPAGREKALSWLRSNGVNTTTQEIIWTTP